MRHWFAILLCCMGCAAPMCAVRAEGESIGGFPNWAERVLHEWTNRARSDPQAEMTACGSACGEGACYGPVAPLSLDQALARAARFHVANEQRMSFFSHDSACTIVADIGSLYPASCDGSASCACQGGIAGCSSGCTAFSDRPALFGFEGAVAAETLAASADPDTAFSLWMHQSHPSSTCDFVVGQNSERYVILKILSGGGAVGAGLESGGSYDALEFGTGSGTPKIPSAAHYPRQAPSVDAWANWFAAAGPSVHKINVDGVCSDMTLDRGTQANGAWHRNITTAASGCHHYVLAFKDGGGSEVIYPTTGALTIGDGSSTCPDYSRAPPPGCAGFDRIFVDGLDP